MTLGANFDERDIFTMFNPETMTIMPDTNISVSVCVMMLHQKM